MKNLDPEKLTPQKLSNELRSNHLFDTYWDDEENFRTFKNVPAELLLREYNLTIRDLKEIANTKYMSSGKLVIKDYGAVDIIVSV